MAGALAISDLSFFLQRNMNKILGPVLLLAGLVLLGTIKFKMSGPTFADRLQGKIEKYGLWGAGILGLLFALSFCSVSAGLFFGSLIPLAVEHESSVLMPTLYGIGTALPVFVFATLIAVGARFVGVTFNRLATFEKWARRVTAVIFILVGVHYCLTYLFNVQLW